MIRWVIARASATVEPGAGSMANSSPPNRATRSSGRSCWRDPLGDRDQELVAGGMAERVVDDLEVVEVEEHDDRRSIVRRRSRPGGARPPRRRPGRFGSPVSESW